MPPGITITFPAMSPSLSRPLHTPSPLLPRPHVVLHLRPLAPSPNPATSVIPSSVVPPPLIPSTLVMANPGRLIMAIASPLAPAMHLALCFVSPPTSSNTSSRRVPNLLTATTPPSTPDASRPSSTNTAINRTPTLLSTTCITCTRRSPTSPSNSIPETLPTPFTTPSALTKSSQTTSARIFSIWLVPLSPPFPTMHHPTLRPMTPHPLKNSPTSHPL
mmetsp:Transcript_21983/g.68808  ORF Transcript_21983/g.68808 Transcript_21983/m.68808 type:complete len:218 (-) Transcript_21983:50-703(-)